MKNKKLKSINPYNQNTIHIYESMSNAEIQNAIDLCSNTFQKWRKIEIQSRVKFVQNLKNLLLSRKEELAKMITLEMGKISKEAISEIEKCALLCDYYAEYAIDFLSPRNIKTEMYKSYVAYQPLGTVLAVMPWNFPFWQVFRAAIPGLLAGNTMLLKHASNVMGCALLIESLFEDSGFPKGTFTSLIIGSSKVKQVLEAQSVVGVALTGSEFAGASVASIAGANIKRQVLELGGSDPFIVLNDADLDKATDVGIASRMLNAGQSCIASKRFIIQDGILDDFMDMTIKKIKNLHAGNPFDVQNTMGPMARLDLVNELDVQLKQGVREGAHVLVGGDRDGCIFQPTLIKVDSIDNLLVTEETFGPLMPIISFKNENEALQIANNSRFGLGASVWTKDLEKGEKMALNIEAGAVFVNGFVRSDPRLPFGGIKDSGYGRELSMEGILEFVNAKTVVVE